MEEVVTKLELVGPGKTVDEMMSLIQLSDGVDCVVSSSFQSIYQGTVSVCLSVCLSVCVSV